MLTTTTPSATPAEEKDRWRTPPRLFALLAGEFGPFTLDAAAEPGNHLCDRWFGPGSPWAEDALAVPWLVDGAPGRVFVNPPYRRGLVAMFVAKAAGEAALGHCRATLLVPAATDQSWWHAFVWSNRRGRPLPGVTVAFLRGRVRFLRPDGSPAGSPSFASVVLHFAEWTGGSRG